MFHVSILLFNKKKHFKRIYFLHLFLKLVLPSLIPVATINTNNVNKNQPTLPIANKNADETIPLQNGKSTNSTTSTITIINRCKQSVQQQQSEKQKSQDQTSNPSNVNDEIAKSDESHKSQISLVKSTIKKLSTKSSTMMSNQQQRIYHSSMDLLNDDQEDKNNGDKMTNRCPLIMVKKCQRTVSYVYIDNIFEYHDILI